MGIKITSTSGTGSFKIRNQGSGGTFKATGNAGTSDWNRPSDWLPMPNVLDTEDKFVGLYAIFPEGQNYAAFLFTTSAGQYRVDWGDGTVTLHNSNTVAQYEYNYASISNSTLTSRGYKQAIITVTPVSGLLRTCNFQQRFVTSPAQNQSYATGFLDCTLSMPNANTGASITIGGSTVRHNYVERFTIKTIGSITSLINLFQNCYSLQSVPLFNSVNVTNMQGMFANCYSLQSVPLFNTQNVTTMGSMFQGCASLQSIPLFNTQNVTIMGSMFNNCYSLQSIPLFNTQNVTDMSSTFAGCSSLTSISLLNTVKVTTMVQMFFNCYSLQTVPLFDTKNVTTMGSMFANCFSLQTVPLFSTINVTNMQGMFAQCVCLQTLPLFNTVNVTSFVSFIPNSYSIQSIPNFSTNSITTASGSNFTTIFDTCTSLDRIQMVFSRSVSMTSCQLSRTALVEIFTNLTDRTSTTSANINITGNWGASALTAADRLIATSKNWTITG